ncbi:accessory Sec system protein Asp2 [Bacillus mycoides]|uniref:accessory Sec system protein Asp2 n=1 Tax=Bacillus mycoides TaxID=1405 RepID=UPI0018CD7F52|nr:accessory Sec system protein Asp2 [Bacillus mycoides]MBG9721214.1 hypothetical protein [Bacillus mycoides]
MNISVLGSGLSQGLFHFQQKEGMNNLKLNKCYLKSSIVSLMSEPIEVELEKINIKSPFLKDCVENDFSKKFWGDIESFSKQSNFFIIDFFEESFNLLKIGDSYVTNTWALKDSGVLNYIKDYIEIDRFSEGIWELWQEKCLLFIEKIKKNFKPNQIILHEVYLAKKYKDGNNFNFFANQEEIRKVNNLLKKYYDFFKDNFPGVRVINFDDEKFYGESGHSWGCKPHNLSDDYYLEMFDYINNTLSLKMEYYKIPFSFDWKFYREDVSVNKTGDILRLQTYRDIDYNTVASCSNYYDTTYGKQKEILPNLEENTKYIVDIRGFTGNLDIRIGFNFYDENNEIVYSKILSEQDNIIRIPKKYKSYRLYLRAKHKGEAQLEYLEIRRYREQGIVTSDDQTFYYEDKVTYLLKEVKNSEKLIIVFSCFDPTYNMTKYDFLGVLRDTEENVLFILDDYGLNGSFYFSENRQDKLQQTIIKLIETICENKNISKKNIITLGGSKGATGALYYGLRMNVGHIVAGAPPLYLGIYTRYNYIHQLSMCYRVSGGISTDDEKYLDGILEGVLHKGIESKISFLSITNDIYYEGYFERFCRELSKNGIAYTNILKEGRGHGDLPKHLGSWAKSVVQNILQPTKNIAIIGSCDSRDIFRVYEENFNINPYNISDYVARSSIISMMSQSINIDIEEIQLQSNFRRKSLYNDISKKGLLEVIEKSDQIDYLIIDFMEERFDILKVHDTYVTNSWEFRESNLVKEWSYDIVGRENPDIQKIWEERCMLLIKTLKKHFKPEQIILHEAYMVYKYKINDKSYKFDEQKNIENMNKILKAYYQFFKNNFTGIHVLSFNQEENYCDANHVWGCQPYHFHDKYYLQAIKFLDCNIK